MEIKTYSFNEEVVPLLKNESFGHNWPVVYIISDQTECYIGETVHASQRMRQHLENPERRKLNQLKIISDLEFNKSATLDVESSLIEFFSAEGIKLQNGNGGLQKHNYFDKDKYQMKFEELWNNLLNRKIVRHSLLELRNTDLFKYSPYKVLSDEQLEISQKILEDLKNNKPLSILISGAPGSGKSILAIYLMKFLKDTKEFSKLKTALVVPMTSFRRTLKKVFKNISSLAASMVVGPDEVVGNNYDLLIVDEAHRLKRRVNLTNYGSFDNKNKLLNSPNGTQFDWILQSSKHQILFYDKDQSIHPSDVVEDLFKLPNFVNYELKTQMRVKGGEEYINFIDFLINNKNPQFPYLKEYDFKIFEDLKEMINAVQNKDKEHKHQGGTGLCRLIAGYAWKWNSKKKSEQHDIFIEDVKLKWNSVLHDWVNSPNAINEVGCIHTIQGYDLNYAGVIIGPELSYDFNKNEFIIYKDKYKDAKGKAGMDNLDDLKKYVLNIYRVLLTRGIYGTYVYICDPNLKKYFKQCYKNNNFLTGYNLNSDQLMAVAEKEKKYGEKKD